jgi:hypothetical protein
MEEVKQELGQGEEAGGTIVKPDKAYKLAPFKAQAAKKNGDLKKPMMMSKKKPDQ